MSQYGFPSHAGIDLHDQGGACAQGRFPRTRGDRPFTIADVNEAPAVSPHTRG